MSGKTKAQTQMSSQQITPEPNQAIALSNQVQSIPKKRGGKRPGAGRKPEILKVLHPDIKPATAASILAQHDESAIWTRFLRSRDERIALDAAKYLTDRRDGKAKQAIEHSGPDGGPLKAAVLVKFVGTEGDK